MKLFLFALVGLPALALGDTVELKAGEAITFKTKWESTTVKCTATPITPTILSKACSCTQYYAQSSYKYRLFQNILLSDGRQLDTNLADGITTIEACNAEKHDEYSEVCGEKE